MKRLEQYVRRISTRFFNRRIALGQQNMLFIVGHMRSCSTLLVHLLVSHRYIIGFGETHHSYTQPEDFGVVAYRIYRSFHRLNCREKYILDKVLHAEHNVTPELLAYGNTRTILLIREPAAAIPSILDVSNIIVREEQALEYYIARLEVMQQFAIALGPKRCAFVTCEVLIDKPESVLERLQSFLVLPPPTLRAEYKTMWSTGRPYIGDPSEIIKRGHIVRGSRTYEHTLSSRTVQRAEAAYESCVEVCQAHLGSYA